MGEQLFHPPASPPQRLLEAAVSRVSALVVGLVVAVVVDPVAADLGHAWVDVWIFVVAVYVPVVLVAIRIFSFPQLLVADEAAADADRDH